MRRMPKITFIEANGNAIETEAENGSTVMETAIMNGVPGIIAECGGACTCATCHCYVDEAWSDIVGPPSMMEEDMLDFAFEVKPTSRLSCQIKVKAELDGLIMRVPSRQG
jgi:2Fe-2S ferredoxin